MNSFHESMSQSVIRTFIKRAIIDIRESPARSTRNLIDMALNFSNGRFQTRFLEAAQEMLRNEYSAYYGLVQDLALHVDMETILTFGMNVGYNSCTAGAAKIRKLEEEYHFNIPWSLTLLTDLEKYPGSVSDYDAVIGQGKELGIYTWLLHSQSKTVQLLPLIEKHPDCAFLLFCPAGEITEELLDETASIHNLMFVVRFGEGAASACEMLRKKECLYSIYLPYEENDAGLITSGGLLRCAENMHPAFTFVVPEPVCPDYMEQLIYHYIWNTRKGQLYQTIPLDLIFDNRAIDSIISDDSCTAVFDSAGNLYTAFGQKNQQEDNLFCNALADIFRHAFPVCA